MECIVPVQDTEVRKRRENHRVCTGYRGTKVQGKIMYLHRIQRYESTVKIIVYERIRKNESAGKINVPEQDTEI